MKMSRVKIATTTVIEKQKSRYCEMKVCVYKWVRRTTSVRQGMRSNPKYYFLNFIYLFSFCQIYISFLSFTPTKKKHALLSLFFRIPTIKIPIFTEIYVADRFYNRSKQMHSHNKKTPHTMSLCQISPLQLG